MRPILMLIWGLGLVLGVGAGTAGEVLDQPFDLAVGGATIVDPNLLHVGFDAVPHDGRCPQGVWCFWEGDATVALWAASPAGARTDFILHTYSGFAQSVVVDGYRIALLALTPYPVFEIPPDPDAYVARLVVSDAPVGAEPVLWGAIKALYR